MDLRTRQRFERMWDRGIPLAEIAKKLHYSFSTLAQLRHSLGLRKRYGHEDDQTLPSPEVIRIRCAEQQTNWTDAERRLRWRGAPHTVYGSIQGYGDCE
jgi:hypothetical protein